MSWLLLGSQLFLSTLLCIAATGKALRQEEFAAALRLSHLPSRLIGLVSLMVPLAEFSLAVALVLFRTPWLQTVYVAVACLFAVFVLWMVWVRFRRLRVRCACFGSGEPVGGRSITRNLLLIVIALGGAYLAAHTSSVLPTSTFWMIATVLSSCMVLALLRGLWNGLPGLALTLDQLEQRRESD